MNGLRGLSTLGRVQLFILLLNVVITGTVINVTAARVNGTVDVVVLAFGVEFLIFTLITIAYTIAVENRYAFYMLIVLQFEQVAFSTATCFVGVLRHETAWVRWALTVVNWIGVFAFLALQRVMRQAWGWHAYDYVGVKVEAVSAYHRYQQLAAMVFFHAFHVVFFVTTEQLVIVVRRWWEIALVVVVAAATILLARPLVLAVREAKRKFLWLICAFYVISFVVFVNFAILISVADARGERSVSEDNGNLPESTLRHLAVAIEWICVVVQCAMIGTVVSIAIWDDERIAAAFAPVQRQLERRYLIDAEKAHGVREVRKSQLHNDVRILEAHARRSEDVRSNPCEIRDSMGDLLDLNNADYEMP